MPDVLVIDSGPGAFATGLYLEAPAAPAQCTYLPMAGLPGLNTAGMSGMETMPPVSPSWTANLEWSEMPIINTRGGRLTGHCVW